MLNNLTKVDIDSIYNEYEEIQGYILRNVRFELDFKIAAQYLQRLLFVLFMIPTLAKNGLIKGRKKEKCSTEEIFTCILNSKHKNRKLQSLVSAFGKKEEKSSFKIGDQEFILQLPINIRTWFSKSYFKNSKTFNELEISRLAEFAFEKINKYDYGVIESLSTIFERDLNYYNFTSTEQVDTENNKIARLLTDRRKKGVFYTPLEITSYMTKKTILSLISQKMTIPLKKLEDLKEIDDSNSIKNLYDILSNLRILDITCGSGEFLLATAKILFELQKSISRKLSLEISDTEVKKTIIENNLFGADLINEALSISRINLWLWFISNQDDTAFDSLVSIDLDFNLVSGNSLIGFVNNHMKEIEDTDEEFIRFLNKKSKKNDFTIDQLIEINPLHWCEKFPAILKEGGFDLVIGNPPYIENKKIRNKIEKGFFSQLYYSAYKLYDIAILFIERALQLLKENGLLSFIITNKFLSTDYGKNIREIILTQSKIHSIIDISYLPVFQDASIYPIILTIEKATAQGRELNLANRFYVSSKIEEFQKLQADSFNKYSRKQIEFFELPKMIFNISSNHEIIQTILNNPSAKKLTLFGKFAYRVLGFTDWNKNIKKITQQRNSDNDFRIIGTTNIKSYSIDYNKPVRLSGKKYSHCFIGIKNMVHKKIFRKPKILIKEIATNLTAAYDPGVFANLTGIYIIIPHDDFLTKNLVLILNSKLMNDIFSSLFSGTHLAGGYLRYNGSYLKEMPIIIPDDLDTQKIFTLLADYLLFLNQIQLARNSSQLTECNSYFESMSNFFVEAVYFNSKLQSTFISKVLAYLGEINFDDWFLKMLEKGASNPEKKSTINTIEQSNLEIIMNSYNKLVKESEIKETIAKMKLPYTSQM